MSKFIEVTGAVTGKKYMINMDDISLFGAKEDGTTELVFRNDADFLVTETYEQVKEMLG